jgi:uncharacterized protein YjiS (DUF1127 family)
MTTLQEFRQSISRFVEGGRKRRQLKREVAHLAAMGSLDAVLADVGLVRSQVEPLIAGCNSRDMLDRMLAGVGIDQAKLPIETMRDMTWTCTTCPDKRQCSRWLADREGSEFHSFCPNAEQIDNALSKQHPGSMPATGANPNGGTYCPSADDLRRMRSEARQREVRVWLDAAL